MKLHKSIAIMVALLFTSLLMQSCFTGESENEMDENEGAGMGMDSTMQRVSNAIAGNTAKDCFTFVYPLEVTWPDGTVESYASGKEFVEFHEIWVDADPEALGSPKMIFPIKVTLEDGSSGVIVDKKALDALLEDCTARSEIPKGVAGN